MRDNETTRKVDPEMRDPDLESLQFDQSKSHSQRRTPPRTSGWVYGMLVLLGLSCCLYQGCGSVQSDDSIHDASSLLAHYESRNVRHDPTHFIEVDLGEFFVTKKIPDSVDLVIVNCHLYAVTSAKEESELTDKLQNRRRRMRDSVIDVIQKIDVEPLYEPSMNEMRSEMTSTINHILRTDAVRDVVFSTFTLEQG